MKSISEFGLKITSATREYYRYTGESAEVEKRGAGCSPPALSWVQRTVCPAALADQLDTRLRSEPNQCAAVTRQLQRLVDFDELLLLICGQGGRTRCRIVRGAGAAIIRKLRSARPAAPAAAASRGQSESAGSRRLRPPAGQFVAIVLAPYRQNPHMAQFHAHAAPARSLCAPRKTIRSSSRADRRPCPASAHPHMSATGSTENCPANKR